MGGWRKANTKSFENLKKEAIGGGKLRKQHAVEREATLREPRRENKLNFTCYNTKKDDNTGLRSGQASLCATC